MELTVPIITATMEDDDNDDEEQAARKKKGGKKQQQLKKKKNNDDVDVQRCIDSYLHPESLDGDNQYECSE